MIIWRSWAGLGRCGDVGPAFDRTGRNSVSGHVRMPCHLVCCRRYQCSDSQWRGVHMTRRFDLAAALLRGLSPEAEAALTTPLIRIPAFSTGDRVIVPPTSGAPDPVYRTGGPGTVCWVREVDGEAFYYVAADGAQDAPQPFRVDELQLEPPI